MQVLAEDRESLDLGPVHKQYALLTAKLYL